MTEAKFTQEIVKRLRATLNRHGGPNTSFVWKINDRITAGIPDLEIIRNGRTVFVEFKRATSKSDTFAKLATAKQKDMLRTLAKANQGGVFGVMRHHEARRNPNEPHVPAGFDWHDMACDDWQTPAFELGNYDAVVQRLVWETRPRPFQEDFKTSEVEL